MPETRIVEVFKNSQKVGEETYTVSDIQLADEANKAEIAAAIVALNSITTLAQLIVAFKKLVLRLAKNGYLP